MDPTGSDVEGDLKDLDLHVLRRAIDLYLDRAYPGAEPPPAVRRRLEWPAGSTPAELLNAPPFERAAKSRTSSDPVFSLRLGNHRYPHMKLQLQPWPNPAGFMLSVNTHDQVLGLDADAADLSAFKDLQAENQRLKEAIELAWDEAGFPTFLRYLREYIESRGEGDAGPETLA